MSEKGNVFRPKHVVVNGSVNELEHKLNELEASLGDGEDMDIGNLCFVNEDRMYVIVTLNIWRDVD